MPNERTMKQIILWLIMIIFVSFLAAVVLFILSGDNWFTDYAYQSRTNCSIPAILRLQ
ncbi:MAG: hypothetical protein WAO57_14340 [Syntrophomonadaceae bacterium]